ATIRFETAAVDPTCTPCDWWDVGSLPSMGVFKPANTLGDGSSGGNVQPYSTVGGGAPIGGGATQAGVRPRLRPRNNVSGDEAAPRPEARRRRTRSGSRGMKNVGSPSA